jgi:hypothetical protein
MLEAMLNGTTGPVLQYTENLKMNDIFHYMAGTAGKAGSKARDRGAG